MLHAEPARERYETLTYLESVEAVEAACSVLSAERNDNLVVSLSPTVYHAVRKSDAHVVSTLPYFGTPEHEALSRRAVELAAWIEGHAEFGQVLPPMRQALTTFLSLWT